MLLLLLWKSFEILLQQDDKGDVSNRDNGSCLGRLSGLESDLGRASCIAELVHAFGLGHEPYSLRFLSLTLSISNK
ncbi:hypothetical protein GQ457_09G021570 [Hibiscus cannabinus]